MTKVGGAVLDAPVKGRRAEGGAVRRMPGAPSLRRGLDRDMGEDFAEPRGREDGAGSTGGMRIRLRGGVPRTTVGKAALAGVLVVGMVGAAAGLWQMRSMLLHTPELVVESSSAIQITGNRHLSRPQLLSVFGEDVERNALTVPLAERRAELERLPWVEHATVMRLLPNRFRVAIVERTPVAFVREGSRIGLVDGHGVLLDLNSEAGEAGGGTRYSFPVISGVGAGDGLSTRAARMKLFARFERELDAGGEAISKGLSEVDVSNPEDVKALMPVGKTEVLVHFGEKDFLQRYELFAKNAAGWQAAHSRLASVDMRYEHQVVLEMEPGSSAAEDKEGDDGVEAVKAVSNKGGGTKKSAAVVKPKVRALAGGAAPRTSEDGTMPVAKGVAAKAAATRGAAAAGGHLQQSFDVAGKHPRGVPQ